MADPSSSTSVATAAGALNSLDYQQENEFVEKVYFAKATSCALTLPIFVFVLYEAWRKPLLRNRSLFFTLYATGVDVLSRMPLFSYYIIRLLTIHGSVAREITRTTDASADDPDDAATTVGNTGSTGSYYTYCDAFSAVLYMCQSITLTAWLHMQAHVIFASLSARLYRRHVTIVPLIICVLLVHSVDITVGLLAQRDTRYAVDLWHSYYDVGVLSPLYVERMKAIDECKFEFFARFTSPVPLWYLLTELCLFGLSFAILYTIQFVKHRRRQRLLKAAAATGDVIEPDADNPVANSPFSHWATRSRTDRIVTVTIFSLLVAITIAYVAGEIIFLLEGNSRRRQVLSISLSGFALVAPIQIIWLNKGLRKAVLEIFSCSRRTWKIKDDDDPSASTATSLSSVATMSKSSTAMLVPNVENQRVESTCA